MVEEHATSKPKRVKKNPVPCPKCGKPLLRPKRHSEKKCRLLAHAIIKQRIRSDFYKAVSGMCWVGGTYLQGLLREAGYEVISDPQYTRSAYTNAPLECLEMIKSMRRGSKVLTRKKRLTFLTKAKEDPTFKELITVDLQMSEVKGSRR